MKLFHFFLGALALLVATSCSNKKKQADNTKVSIVKTDTVRLASSLSVLQFPAKVKAAHDINLSFKVSGTIENIRVKEGEAVRKGQLLAQLDPTDYEVQLQATEAEYNQIKGEAQRVMALYQENGTTPNANDKARYGLQQIEAKYKNHRDQLEYTRMYAPFDGFVQKRLFDSHETVAAGMPVISIISREAPEVELNLPASEYIRRNEFELFSCTFDVFPGKTYNLTPIGITEKANSNQLYTMRLKVEKNTLPLPSPGMNTMVSITCKSGEQTVWAVPGSSVMQKDGKEFLFIYKNGHVYLTEVKSLRLKSDGSLLIHCNQLKQGSCIVSSGIHYLKDGQAVRILQPVSSTNEGGLL